MATDPSSIIASLLQGGANVGQSVQQGFTQGLQDQSDQQTLQLNALKIQQATQAQQQAQQQAVAKQAAKTAYDADPSPVNLNKLIEAAPDDADALTKGYQMLEAPRQQSLKTLFGQIYSAAGNQSPDALASAVSPIIAAEKAQGVDTTDAQTMLDNLQSGDPDKVASAITGAKAFSQMHLSALDPKFAESLGIGGDSNKPYTLGEGEKRFDANNNLVATGGPKGMEPFHYTLKDASGQEHEYIYNPGSGPLPPGAVAAPGASGASALAPNGQLDPQAFFKQFVLPHEGGYAPHDANGAPVNHGINQSANPGVDVKNLSADDAAQIFATKYFPSSANLPPALAAVNADTAFINPKRAAQFLQASGGDPAKYMAMRQSWMNSLIQNDPQTYGKYAKAWGTRNADLSAYAQNLGGGAAPSGAPPVSGGMPSGAIGGSQQIDGLPVNDTAPGDSSPIPANLSGPQAMAYLQQKNPGLGNRISGIMSGNIPYPSATRKDTQPILNAISQIDPTFDATTWKDRNTTGTNYGAGGKVGINLTQGATAINHLYDVAVAAQNLPDHEFQWMNKAALGTTFNGSPQGQNIVQFNRSRTLYAPELNKYLSGTGGTSEGETNKQYNSYDPSLGKTNILKTAVTDTNFIANKFDQQAQSYQQTMGKPLVIDGQGATGGPATAKLAALRWWSNNQDKPIPAVVMAPAQAARLPSGTTFVTPDGQIRVKH